jgi:hypothetical protein
LEDKEMDATGNSYVLRGISKILSNKSQYNTEG